jgi:hypothetical protein
MNIRRNIFLFRVVLLFMQAETTQQPYISTRPLARPTENVGEAVGFAKLFFVTLTFVLFCAATIAGVWYFSTFFQNDSYKMVSSFLLLIVVANVVCKYWLWYWRHYGVPAEMGA